MTEPEVEIRAEPTRARSVDVGRRRYEVRIRTLRIVQCRIWKVARLVDTTVTEHELAIEVADARGRVVFSQSQPVEAGAKFAAVGVEGSRGRGVVVQVASKFNPEPDSDTDPDVAELTVLSARDDQLVPLLRTLWIFGSLEDPSPAGTARRLGPGDALGVVLQGGRFDPICPAVVDWTEGLRLPAEADCRLPGEQRSRLVGAQGKVTLYSAPRDGSPSVTLDVEPSTPLTPLRVHGRTDVGPTVWRSFGDEWLEVDIGGRRGWLRAAEDLDLLGFEVPERC